MEMLRTDYDRLAAMTAICGPKVMAAAIAQLCAERAIAEETAAKDGYRQRYHSWHSSGQVLSRVSDRMLGPDLEGLQMPASDYQALEGILARSGCKPTVAAIAVFVAEWDRSAARRLQLAAETVSD